MRESVSEGRSEHAVKRQLEQTTQAPGGQKDGCFAPLGVIGIPKDPKVTCRRVGASIDQVFDRNYLLSSEVKLSSSVETEAPARGENKT